MKMKMKTIITMIIAGGLIQAAAVAGEHPAPRVEKAQAKITPQTTCPVMGGKIRKDQYVDHAGKRIYMCCKGCTGKLEKDPATYIKKLEAEGVTVATVQTTCPVMDGKKIEKDQYVDHDGKRIYVCCKGCIGKIQADPAPYVAKLEQAGIALDMTPASLPPHTGDHD